MARLADILVTLTLDTSEFNDNLQEMSRNIDNMSRNVGDATQRMSQSVVRNSRQMGESLERVGYSSRYLARTLGTDTESMNRVLQAAQGEFDRFAMNGRRVSQAIKDEFMALPGHLQRYVQRLREAGQSTAAFAALNEQYSSRVIDAMRRSNDYMQNRTMQSTRLIQHLNEQPLMGLSQQFLRLGEQMEATARSGTALNLALQRVGDTSNLKALRDEIKFIEQGIARARGAFLVFGIGTGLAVWGLVKMSNAIDGRLIPALDRMKTEWTGALTPFVHAFTTFVVWIMNGVTAIGSLMNAFAKAHPQLSQMLYGIILLTFAIGTLLAPLAVGIGLTGGLAASFSALWATIAPFVLGFLTVAGIALIIATAIVTLTAVINNLWTQSEGFRQAWITIWSTVKAMFVTNFVNPVKTAWEDLKSSFSGLIAQFTGGAGTMNNLWKFLGDSIGIAVQQIASVVLPIMGQAFSVMGQIVVGVINGIIAVVGWLTAMWNQHGTQITAVLTVIWNTVLTVFGAISSFIMSQMPVIKEIVAAAFEYMKTAIELTMKYIAPVVIQAFGIIANIIKTVMPVVVAIVKNTWNSMKQIISSTLQIIKNLIQMFSNILKGNWKGAWENVKNILKNVVNIIWNLIKASFIGKIIKAIIDFGTKIVNNIRNAWNKMFSVIGSVVNRIKAKVSAIWGAIVSTLQGKNKNIVSDAINKFNSMRNRISGIFNAIKGVASRVFNAVKKAITDPIGTAKSLALKAVSAIKGGFNRMKIKIPKFKLPKISVDVAWGGPGKKIPYPKFGVQWNAKGNIFNGASILGGGQGVGEAGAEAVMPIQHKRYMRPYASAVANHLAKWMNGSGSDKTDGGTQYTIQFHEPVVIREDADIQRIVDELERRRKISERAKGVFSY